MAARTIVITGASDGIGARAAETLARTGHRVVVVGRSPSKTRAVAERIGIEHPVDHHVADFADLAQVRALADALAERHPRIDVLVNNAGGVFRGHELTTDGHEKTLQVNHLAPFLLTNLLLEPLRRGRASVISTASTGAVTLGDLRRLDTDDLDDRRELTGMQAYGDAKLATILFSRELHRRFGDRLSAVSFHPGHVATNFASDTTASWRYLYRTPLRHVMLSSVRRGAEPLVWLADGSPGGTWQRGSFYLRTTRTELTSVGSDPELDAVGSRLWERSARLVGLPARSSAAGPAGA